MTKTTEITKKADLHLFERHRVKTLPHSQLFLLPTVFARMRMKRFKIYLTECAEGRDIFESTRKYLMVAWLVVLACKLF